MVTTGWLAFSESKPVPGLSWVIVCFVLILSAAASAGILMANQKYMVVAKVIEKINFALYLFKQDAFLSDDTLYPESWKGFGTRNKVTGVVHHLAVIWIASVVCVTAVILKFHTTQS